MSLGQQLKKVRRSKGMTLQQVADGAGLSKSFVSQIESDRAKPSIASLKKIGDVLDIPLATLFDEETNNGTISPFGSIESDDPKALKEVRVVRRTQRKMLVWPGRNWKAYLLTPDLQHKLEVFIDEMEPGGSDNEPYCHVGEEFGLVLEGRCEVTVGGEVFELEAGDSIYYPCHLPHTTRVLGDCPARAIWVVTPPSF
jgi:transcriptional regulator with XRE-family HTH domain